MAGNGDGGALVRVAREELPLGEVARAAAACGWFGCDPAQAIIKLLWAQELGIGKVTALAEIAVIKGRPVMSAHLIASQIKASARYDFRCRENTAEKCALEFFERGETLGVYTFTLEDAKRAGLVRPGPWINYPKAMLFARAVSAGYRVHCPDVFASAVYVEGELGEDAHPAAAPLPVKAEPVDVSPPTPEPVEELPPIRAPTNPRPVAALPRPRRTS
jgi:hypothetical protein